MPNTAQSQDDKCRPLLPSPASWALTIAQASGPEAGWQAFAQVLTQIGFSAAAYEAGQRGLQYATAMPLGRLLDSWEFPVLDRVSNARSVLHIYCFSKLSSHTQLLAIHGNYLQACTIYLGEGFALREIVDGEGVDLLSQREQDCLAWAGAGKSTKEIASLLAIACSTVNEYITHAQHKLRATNRAQAAARAMLLGAL